MPRRRKKKWEELVDEPGQKEKEEYSRIISEGKPYAVMGYLWILCFIPLLVKRENLFALHHGKQGLLLFISWLIVLVISAIPVIGPLLGVIGNIIILVLAISGILHALKGEYWQLPWLGGRARELNI